MDRAVTSRHPLLENLRSLPLLTATNRHMDMAIILSPKIRLRGRFGNLLADASQEVIRSVPSERMFPPSRPLNQKRVSPSPLWYNNITDEPAGTMAPP